MAVENANESLIELLILNKANVNHTDLNSQNVLFYAVDFNLKEIVKLLISHKIDIN